MKRIKKIVNFVNKYYSTFIGTLLSIIFISLLFFAFFPFQVAEFKKININNEVKVGGIVDYTNDYCQNVNKGITREITRFLVPKDTKLVSPIELSGNPTDETQNDAGCRTSQPIKLPIDSSVPEGEYKLLVKVKYHILFRTITVQGESDYFDISKPDVATLLITINEQLNDIRMRVDGPVANSQQILELPAVSVPNVQPDVSSQSQPPQPSIEPERAQSNRGIIESTIDVTRETVSGILNVIGGNR